MGALILAGPSLNLLGRGSTSLAAGTALASVYGAANLYDGEPHTPFVGNGVSAAYTFKVDTARGSNMDFETWSDASTPGTWSKEGTIAREATIIHGGTYSAKITGATGRLRQRFSLRSGSTFYLSLWLRGDGTAGLKIHIVDLATGKELNSSGAWVAPTGTTYWATGPTAASWVQSQGAVRTEGYETTLLDQTEVQVTIGCHDAGSGYADDASLTEAVDWLSVHQHNLDPGTAVTVESSWDDSTWTPLSKLDLAPTQPECYAWNSGGPEHGRYFRVTITPTLRQNYAGIAASARPFVGELVLGCAHQLAGGLIHPAISPMSDGSSTPMARATSPALVERRYPRGTLPVRSLGGELLAISQAIRDSVERNLFGRAQHGAGSLVVVAPASAETAVALGWLSGSCDWRRSQDGLWTASLQLQGGAAAVLGQ
jgi:hypothetical protein